MKRIGKMRISRKRETAPDDGPLFRWAKLCPAEHFPNQPRPVRVLARRFGLAPLRARLVAELAGFNLENNQHG